MMKDEAEGTSQKFWYPIDLVGRELPHLFDYRRIKCKSSSMTETIGRPSEAYPDGDCR
jgi:hypothetical protein